MSGRILLKVTAARFYRINTGFFLLSFIALFGLLDGKSTMALHYSVMQGISSSYTFAGVAMLVWALYNIKCISYGLKVIEEPENSFIFRLQSLGSGRQLYLLLRCHVAMYLPLLVYGGMTVVVGFSGGHYLLPVLFIIFQLMMCGAGAAIYFNRINSTWRKPPIALPTLSTGSRKTFLMYLLHYSMWSRKGTFAGVKLFSLVLLQAMVAANTNKLSKEAICVLIMFLISAHSLLPLYYVRFMEGGLAFTRNMPIPVMRRLLVFVVTYAIILLPELLFLLLNEHHVMPLQLTLSLYAVGVAQLTLYTSLQYIKGMQQGKYTGFVFGLFFVNLLLLASFNLWLLCVVESVVAVAVFVWGYDRYEVAAGEE